MKKLVSVIAKTLLGLILLLAVLLLAHPLWLAPVAKRVANSVVPGMTKTEFNLASLSLNAYDGKVSVGGLILGNPAGYDERVALKVGSVSVVADTGSLASDVIRFREVTVKDVFVCYTSRNGEDNFSRISKNVSESGSGSSSARTEPDVKNASAEKSGSVAGSEAKKSKKVIIERLDISGIVVKFGPIPLPVPPIVLTGVGEKSNGVTLMELGNQLLTAIMNGVGSVKDGVGALGALLGEGAGGLGEQLKKGDMKAVRGAAGVLKSMFKQTDK